MKKLKILILEDNKLDAKLIKEELTEHKIDFTSKLVETEKDFITAIHNFKPDIILSDYTLPQFTGFEALDIAKKLAPDIPFIIVTGSLTEETAVESITRGAWNYVIKENLHRLTPAIENACKLKEEKDKKKQTEKDLRESEERYRVVVENSHDGIIIVGEDFKFEYVNDWLCEIFGYRHKEILGHDFREFLDKDSKQLVSDRYIKRQRGEDVPPNYEFNIIKKDGEKRQVEISSSIVKDSHGNVKTVAHLLDITERKRAEKALLQEKKFSENLLETANTIILTLDKNANITTFNKFSEKLTGYKKEKVLGKNWFDLFIPKRDRSEIPKVFSEVLKGMPEVSSYENPILCKNGFERLISWKNTLLKNDKGEISGILSIGVDITERKKAEEEIKLLKDLLLAETEYLRKEIKLSYGHKNIIGESKAIKQVLNRVELVAKTLSTVLLLGETGTGKELIAQRIHELSTRKNKTLIKINCGALPISLIESELFGKEKGAYTGAMTKQIGYFELADNSTIFLDEIGDLPLELQVKILRVIQDGQFERLGSPKTIKVNVRIIAATNCNLEKKVLEGKFRRDLYYRLNVFPITLPPLRERPEDIPLLSWSFVREFEKAFGKKIDKISLKSMDDLQHYSWPGNIRELRNVIEHSMIINQSNKLRIEIPSITGSISSAFLSLEELERQHITQILASTGWRVKGKNGAAEILKLKPTTLYSKIKRLGIKRT